MDPLATSPFVVLDARVSLRLVTDRVHEDDALCLALTCRALRDALWVRFPSHGQLPKGGYVVALAFAGQRVGYAFRMGPHGLGYYVDPARGGHFRIRTRNSAFVERLARVAWAQNLPEPDRPPYFLAPIYWNCPRLGITPDLLGAKAVAGGHLAVLAWLHKEHRQYSNTVNWDQTTVWNQFEYCKTAARRGHLTMLKWLYTIGLTGKKNEYAMDGNAVASFTGICHAAAKGGQLEVLQWLRERGCPWGPDTCLFAAERGHLAVLQWARANACPWNRYKCLASARGLKHTSVEQWITEQIFGRMIL